MPKQAFAAHLDAVSSTVTSPFHFLAVIFSYLSSLAAPLVDTPAERDSVEAMIMAAYDKIVLGLAASNPALAGLFMAFRKYVLNSIDAILLSLTPPPAPTPAPAVVAVTATHGSSK